MKSTFTLLFVCVFTTIGYAQAQTEQTTKAPSLNSHKYVNFESMKSPFITTNFFLELGMGESGLFTTQGVPVGDTTRLNLSGEILFVELKGGYQQRVKDWISFFVNIDYAARLGNSVESLYVSGVNTILTVEPGIVFKALKTEKTALSGYVKLTNTQSSIVDIQEYLNDLIVGKKYASITKDVPALNGGGGIVLLHAFSPSFGFNFDGQLVYGETLKRDNPKFQYYIGSNISFNLDHLLKIPVSLIVGGYANTLTNAFSTQGSLTSTFSIKVAYTGSDNFTIGIETYRGQTPIEDTNQRVQLNGFSFVSRFYF
ncbi:hypothetical protein N7E81_00645 [Reichenbachiella carrageenanivorans]|uniref:Uncharacterized protein n=1 Tax=Reichenbachiella carrageenanivorans TaxID=2979869 RepID=A0ABY6D3I4_9BACT|nr:hypothetical protein [Reichenbachiella carrageenanivorans]UXX79618.1 hypothetical protein N7E81_00645 [Reichenbachiella carrageenanivorans]